MPEKCGERVTKLSERLSWGGEKMGIRWRRGIIARRGSSRGEGIDRQEMVNYKARWKSIHGGRAYRCPGRGRALFSLVCGGFKLRPLPRYNGRSSVQPQTAQWCFSPRPRHLYIKIIRSPPLFTTRIHSLSSPPNASRR